LLPGAWLNMKGILSEFPYMALTFGALVAHRRFTADPRLARASLLGALIAAAMLTRTIGVALWAALACVEALAYLRARDAVRGETRLRHPRRQAPRHCSRGTCCVPRAARMPTSSSAARWRAARPATGSPGSRASPRRTPPRSSTRG
jgi:hypothetical protein